MDMFVQIPVGRPKDLEKRQNILNAAKAVFLKNGYHGSSMNHIAQEAGVTKLTVYNHFQDKQNLFICAIEATCEESISAKPLTLSADSNFHEVLHQTCGLALNVVNLPEAIKLEHLLLELAAEKNPLAVLFFNASHQRMNMVWGNLFSQAASFGFIQSNEIDKQICLILSLLLGMRHHEVLLGIRNPPDAKEKESIITECIDLFLLKYSIPPKYLNSK